MPIAGPPFAPPTTFASIEQIEAAHFLHSTLSGDSLLSAAAPGGVWSHPAPDARPGVWVAINLQADHDVQTAQAVTVWNSSLWLVRAYAETRDWEDLIPAAARIHTLLHTPNSPVRSTAAGLVYSSSRESGFMQPEIDNGREYRALGGLYRLQVQLAGT